jgi:hypothetical protein
MIPLTKDELHDERVMGSSMPISKTEFILVKLS